ncbi:short-chain dehydrogenase [Bifidobacterium goeldii]|uniref:Short-chain dehydrogenase n=1 Tax=Bifidobacterium goeldii TaxID=2306975 RepID=A0A430FLS7_9BIFI|nr:SDR family oxidoreductase [Bifidobacterium goeldii]RSX53844.1 short-chain dehydrogenase [Bifidobacterium goeldii]
MTNPNHSALFDLTGEVAVVTGAASGLGADAARAYADAGAAVALLDVNEDGLDAVRAELEAKGASVTAIRTDVSSESEVRDAIAAVTNKLGEISIVFNDAGIFARDSAETFSDDEWDHVFAVNLKSILHTTKYVIDGFKRRGWGKIVNVSSVNAFYVDSDERYVRDSYYSSKAAILGLTRALAARYAKYGVTVNAICPGLFKTGITANNFEEPGFGETYAKINPSGRYGQPGELNGTVLYLSSHASDYVQGQYVIVDGGLSLL